MKLEGWGFVTVVERMGHLVCIQTSMMCPKGHLCRFWIREDELIEE